MNNREYFAAMALQGLLAGRSEASSPGVDRFGIVHEAVASADALIFELKRTTPKPQVKAVVK